MSNKENTLPTKNTSQEHAFDLSCCKLLEKHPLYNYRVQKETGKTDLSVLLIGSGNQLNILRNKVLSNGQLLNTELNVTVLTEDPAQELNELMNTASELYRFIRIQGVQETHPVQWDLGTLRFEGYPKSKQKLRAFFRNYPLPAYTIISTGSDDRNELIRNALHPNDRQLVAWVQDGIICTNTGSGDRFDASKEDSCLEELRRIAYHLHYSYEKGNDPHITDEEIRKTFQDDDNYASNIECALHVRSKIKCAGLDPSSLDVAAESFAKRLEADAQENGNLLEELARLEHRRWCISKLVQGKIRGSAEHCYLTPGEGTHSKKWHVCLVPYGQGDILCRRLTEQDWNDPDFEDNDELDELDKQTLRVHNRCRQLMDACLHSAAEQAEAIKAGLPDELAVYGDHILGAIGQMHRGDRSAVALYRHHLRKLQAELKEQKNERFYESLKELGQTLGAPIEHLTRKDYKEQNFVLVSRIPFALSHWKKNVLVKLMADKIEDCISSAWQLEPNQVLFVDTAEKLEDLRNLSSRARQIDRFFSIHAPQVSTSFHIFVPKHVPGLEDHPAFFENCNWSAYPLTSMDTSHLRPRFVALMQQFGVTSMDVTGGKPRLITLADGYAQNNRAGAFYIRDQELRDLYGTSSIAHQALDKGLSVQELFDQAAAVKIKQDAQYISAELNARYRDLWAVCHDNADVWHWFCACFSTAYRDQPALEENAHPLFIQRQKLHESIRESQFPEDFRRILEQLEEKQILTARGDGYLVSCEEVLSALRNTGKALEYYIYCTANASGIFRDVSMSWMFRHSDNKDSAKNEVDVICTHQNTTLFISAKNVTQKTFQNDKNFLNYVCYEVGWLADRFAGAHRRMLLAAPNIATLDGQDKLSHLASHALSRGVYLLGSECFENDNLVRVFRAILEGREQWYACLAKNHV